ncbi:MAG: protein kinase domain-containing protein [Planctomycetota bacterium]
MTEALQTGDPIGPYRIAAELGRGGMGAVYRAIHRELGHEVALKVILPDDAGDEESRRRFQREAMAAARLAKEPGIVGVRDYGEDAGRLWFAMPLVKARTLEFEIDAGDLQPSRAAALVAQAARAVHRAHAHGIIHRDLKPANVLVDRDGTVWVNDFGLARFTSAGGDGELSKLTRTGYFVGTPNYMAPEQITGKGLDARADVYGLGATLYDALTGRPPFEGDTLAVTLTLVMRMDAAPPSSANPLVPAALDAVVQRCLAKEPDDRYPTALAVAEDLERFAGGESVKATQVGLLTTARRSVLRHPTTWTAVAGALLVAATFAGFSWWASSRTAGTEQAITKATKVRTAAEQAQALQEVWADLTGTTAQPIRALQDRLFGVPTSQATVDEALAAVHAAIQEVRGRHPDSRLPDAWYGLALIYADRAAEGIQRIDAALRAGDDPLCDVVLARAHCARFLSQLQPPSIVISTSETMQYLAPLNDEMKQDFESARSILAAAKAHALWSELGPSSAVVRYAQVLQRLFESYHEQASMSESFATLLEGLRDEPLLADETALLEGFARFYAGDATGAATAWSRPAHRRWPAAVRLAISAWLVAARDTKQPASERLVALDQAAALLDEIDAEALDTPARARHFCDRGLVAWLRADTLPIGDARGSALLDAAAGAFAEALRLQPGDTTALRNGAVVLQARARRPDASHEDAIRWLRQAIELLDRSAAGRPPDAMWHSRRGVAYVDLARRLSAAGQDPLDTYQRAVDDFDAALQLPHANGKTLLVLKGAALHDLGKAQAARGRSPALAYARASAAFKKRFTLGKPGRLALVHAANLAYSVALATQDPLKKEQALVQAMKAASEVLKVLPEDYEALQLRGLVYRQLAETAIGRGKEPHGLLEQAETDYGRAIDAQPGAPQPRSGRGLVRYRMGVIAAARGRNGVPQLEAAIADFDAALERAPQFADAMHGRASCRVALAELEALAGRDPIPAWDAAVRDADAAVALAPRSPSVRFFRGKAYYDRALAKAKRMIEPADDLQRALGEFRQASTLLPTDWRGPFLQGMCLDKLGRQAEALAQMEAAAKLNPKQPMVRKALEQLRAGKDR